MFWYCSSTFRQGVNLCENKQGPPGGKYQPGTTHRGPQPPVPPPPPKHHWQGRAPLKGVLPLRRCAQIKIPAGINQGLAAASTVAPVVYSLPWWYKSLGNRNAPGCTTTMIWSTFSIIASCDHIIMISCHNVIIQANFFELFLPKNDVSTKNIHLQHRPLSLFENNNILVYCVLFTHKTSLMLLEFYFWLLLVLLVILVVLAPTLHSLFINWMNSPFVYYTLWYTFGMIIEEKTFISGINDSLPPFD